MKQKKTTQVYLDTMGLEVNDGLKSVVENVEIGERG